MKARGLIFAVVAVAALAGCALTPIVRSEGVRSVPDPAVSGLQPNVAPLPCVGALTDIVLEKNNVGWGWNEDVLHIVGAGLMRRKCRWVKPAQSSDTPFSLIVSVFQPGDQIVADIQLRDNKSGEIVVSRRASHDHNYEWYRWGNSGAYTVPRDQVVSSTLRLVLTAAMDDL